VSTDVSFGPKGLASSAPPEVPSEELPRTPLELFIAFSSLSLSGFGGVMPFAYRALVEKRRWITGQDFAALVGVAQVLPGPTICNMAVMVGMSKGGKMGGAMSLLGMVLGPMVIVLALGIVYEHVGGFAPVQAALRGMSAVAAGLIFATAVKMGRAVFIGTKIAVSRRLVMFGWCVLAFVGVGLMHWPLALVVAVLAPLAVAFEWHYR
jgi:chromate transporter